MVSSLLLLLTAQLSVLTCDSVLGACDLLEGFQGSLWVSAPRGLFFQQRCKAQGLGN